MRIKKYIEFNEGVFFNKKKSLYVGFFKDDNEKEVKEELIDYLSSNENSIDIDSGTNDEYLEHRWIKFFKEWHLLFAYENIYEDTIYLTIIFENSGKYKLLSTRFDRYECIPCVPEDLNQTSYIIIKSGKIRPEDILTPADLNNKNVVDEINNFFNTL